MSFPVVPSAVSSRACVVLSYGLLLVMCGCAATNSSDGTGHEGDASAGTAPGSGAENCPASGYGPTVIGTSSPIFLTLLPTSTYFPDKDGNYAPNNSESPACCHQVDLTCTVTLKAILGATSSDCSDWHMIYFPTADCTQQVAPACQPKLNCNNCCDPSKENGKTLVQQLGATSSSPGGEEWYVRSNLGELTLDSSFGPQSISAQDQQILTPLAQGKGYFSDSFHGYFFAASYRPRLLTLGAKAQMTVDFQVALVTPADKFQVMQYNDKNTIVAKNQFTLVLEGPNPK